MRASLFRWVLPLLVLTLALSAFAHGGEDHGGTSARSPRSDEILVPIETQFLIGLRTARAQRTRIAPTVSRVGQVLARPDGDARIAAPVAGRLLPPPTGFPTLGARVQQGQVLAMLDQTLGATENASITASAQSVAFARNDARARLSAAEARLRLAESQLERLRGLSGVVPARELAEQETERASAAALVEQARRDLASTGASNTSRTLALRSPLDGVVVRASASAGSQLQAGAELFHVVELSRLWIDVRISESEAAGLDATSECEVTSSNDARLHATGRRIALGALVEQNTRTVQSLFEVANPDGRLRVGALVDVSVTTGAPEETLAIPRDAVLDHNGVPSVIVRLGPERFVVRGVRTGPRNGSHVGISFGLRAGDRVVVEGASSVLLAAE